MYAMRDTYVGLWLGGIVIGEHGLGWGGWYFFAFDLSDLRRLGFTLPRYTNYQFLGWDLTIPVWLAVLISAIPTAVLWHRDRRTVKPGYCVKCGYDLRASKKTCPECGTAIAPELR